MKSNTSINTRSKTDSHTRRNTRRNTKEYNEVYRKASENVNGELFKEDPKESEKTCEKRNFETGTTVFQDSSKALLFEKFEITKRENLPQTRINDESKDASKNE